MAYVAPNLTLQTLLAAKRQTDPDTEATPVVNTTPTDVISIFGETNPFQLDARRITVQDITGSFTKDSDVIGRKLFPITFQHHLSGNGATGANLEPNWIRLVEACGHSVASNASGGSSSWVLTPKSTGVTALSFNLYVAKTLLKGLHSFGTASIEFPAGNPAVMSYNFMAEYADPVSQANFPTTIVRQNKQVKMVESALLTIGSYSPRASMIRMDFAEQVQEREDVNSAEGLYGLYIGDRNPTVTITVEADENMTTTDLGSGVDLWEALKNVTTQNLQWTIGTNANNFKTTFTANAAQLVAQRFTDLNRRRMFETTWKLRNATADGEYSITHYEKA